MQACDARPTQSRTDEPERLGEADAAADTQVDVGSGENTGSECAEEPRIEASTSPAAATRKNGALVFAIWWIGLFVDTRGASIAGGSLVCQTGNLEARRRRTLLMTGSQDINSLGGQRLLPASLSS